MRRTKPLGIAIEELNKLVKVRGSHGNKAMGVLLTLGFDFILAFIFILALCACVGIVIAPACQQCSVWRTANWQQFWPLHKKSARDWLQQPSTEAQPLNTTKALHKDDWAWLLQDQHRRQDTFANE